MTAKIVVVTGIYPPDHGGPATFVPLLAKAATDRGWKVEVVTLADEVSENIENAWSVTRIPRRISKPVRMAKTAAAIASRLKKADVMFAVGLFEEAAIASFLSRKPWVAKFVGDPAWETFRNARPQASSSPPIGAQKIPIPYRLRRVLTKLSLRTSQACITPSCELAALLNSWGISQSMFVPNGVDCLPLKSIEAQTDVITVCRLVPWKQVDALIRVCGALGASLEVVGDGPQAVALRELARSLDLDSRVHFQGHLDHGEVARAIDRSRVFVLLSTYEGMSFSLLEAMSRAKPVIAGNNAGNAHVVQSGVNGILVDPFDEDALATHLRRLLAEPEEARRLGLQARHTIENEYSLSSCLDRTLEVVGGAIQRGGGIRIR